MKISTFDLERYFAKHEFSAKYLLSCSDCEPLSMSELLQMADQDTQQLWQNLKLGYTETFGHPLLREAIAEIYQGLEPKDILSVVPEEGIFLFMHALLEPGDHIVCTFPGYQSLYEIARSIGCSLSLWQPDEDKGWHFDIARLEKELCVKTKLVVVNFPHNPTGYMPTKEQYLEIIDLARKRNIYLLSDEMYRYLEIKPGATLPSACEVYERAFSLFGLSKTFGLPGLRLGWMASKDAQILTQMSKLKDYTTICGSAPSEILAIIALKNQEKIITKQLQRIQKNIAILERFFDNNTLFRWNRPMGGSVCFPRLLTTQNTDVFCDELIKQTGIMLVPSSTFQFGDRHVRIGFGRENFAAVMDIFSRYINKHISSGSQKQELEYSDSKSKKFWHIELKTNSYTVTYGKQGTAGKSIEKMFSSHAEAKKTYDKQIQAKLKKGYMHVHFTLSQKNVSQKAGKSKKKKIEKKTKINTVIVAKKETITVPSSRIDLPIQYSFLSYDMPKPLPVQEPVQEFDYNNHLELLAKIAKDRVVAWENIIPPFCSKKEARFWWQVLINWSWRKNDCIRFIEDFEKNKDVPLLDIFNARDALYCPEAIAILRSVPFDALWQGLSKKIHNLNFEIMIAGFRKYILPYMSLEEREECRKIWRFHWDKDNLWYAAMGALLGAHQEMHKIVVGWKDYLAKNPYQSSHHQPNWFILGLEDATLVKKYAKDLKIKLGSAEQIKAWLAITKYSCLDLVYESIVATMSIKYQRRERVNDFIAAFATVKDPAVAPYMLKLKMLKEYTWLALEWLQQNVIYAIFGLVDLCIEQGEIAQETIDYLKQKRQQGYSAYIKKAIENASFEVAQKVQAEVLDREQKKYVPFEDKNTPKWLIDDLLMPAKKPKKCPWLSNTLLPPIVIKDKCLNKTQIEILIKILQQSTLTQPPQVMSQLKKYSSVQGLDLFAWKLIEMWLLNGDYKEIWPMHIMGFWGEDLCIQKIAPLLKKWPKESSPKLAFFALDCMTIIATDIAISHILDIAQKMTTWNMDKYAKNCLEKIATKRKVTVAELQDFNIPSCGLDKDGRKNFDFGSRKFAFAFNMTMDVVVKSENGEEYKNLPKPQQEDNLDKAKQAKKEWNALKKQVTKVLQVQSQRLEKAMIESKFWPRKRFYELLSHPLMRHLTQRILWQGKNKEGLSICFYINRNLQLLNKNDQQISLEQEGIERVRIVHPLFIATEKTMWQAKIIHMPPFAQLTRDIYTFEAQDLEEGAITRFKNITIGEKNFFSRLRALSWKHGPVGDNHGEYFEHYKDFNGIKVIVEHEKCFMGLSWSNCGTNSILKCSFDVDIKNIPSVIVSEVLRDLHIIATLV